MTNEELRELASAAALPKGPWKQFRNDDGSPSGMVCRVVDDACWSCVALVQLEGNTVDGVHWDEETLARWQATGDFIAACDPQTVIGLLDELARVERDADEKLAALLVPELQGLRDDLARVTKERDEAFAALARKVSHDDECALVQDPSGAAACSCADVGRTLRAERESSREGTAHLTLQLVDCEAENVRLREALEPFAKAVDCIPPWVRSEVTSSLPRMQWDFGGVWREKDDCVGTQLGINATHLVAARDALAPPPAHPADSSPGPMGLAALVLGYNELAKQASTLGDKIVFRLHRDEANKLLRASGSKWAVEFSEPQPCEHQYVVLADGMRAACTRCGVNVDATALSTNDATEP